jgi:hypothetical protein
MSENALWDFEQSFALSPSSEGLQRNLLLAIDFEEGVQPGELKKVLHVFVEVHKFHFTSPLPDRAITANQFTHAIAVNEIHTLEIEQKFLMAVAGQDVDQVTELRATVTQRESSNRINHSDPVELSCGDLKTHGGFATFCFSRGIIYSLDLCFQQPRHSPGSARSQ